MFFMNFIEDYFPNMHTFGAIHDSWVDDLVKRGWVDSLANIPTMPVAYLEATLMNLAQDILDIYNLATGKNEQLVIWVYHCKCE